METTFDVGPSYEKDTQEYAVFCESCGLFLVDGLQMWRDALKAMGIADRAIEVKLSSAVELLRRIKHQFESAT